MPSFSAAPDKLIRRQRDFVAFTMPADDLSHSVVVGISRDAARVACAGNSFAILRMRQVVINLFRQFLGRFKACDFLVLFVQLQNFRVALMQHKTAARRNFISASRRCVTDSWSDSHYA